MTHLQCCKVDDTVNLRMFFENFVKAFLVCNVDIVECGLLAADKFNSIQNFGRGVVEIVNNDYFVASFKKCKGGEGANIAGATVALLAETSAVGGNEHTQ